MRFRIVAAVALITLAILAPSSPVEANPSISKSVTLVIDFGKASALKTKVANLTDVPEKATGWDLFGLAGMKVQGTQQFPTGFVCRIAAWPPAKKQDCADTPTFKEGHWAYFVTNFQLSKGWILSGQGAASHIPDCGGYEGWSWVAGGQANQPPRFKVDLRACK